MRKGNLHIYAALGTSPIKLIFLVFKNWTLSVGLFKSPGNTDKIHGKSLEVVWTNSTHEFSLITPSSSWKFPSHLVAIGSLTLEVVLTNSAHEVKVK